MTQDDDRLIGSTEICRLLNCHITTIYRLRRDEPTFPRPINGVTGAKLAWKLSEVQEYIARKQKQSKEVA